VAGAMRSPPPEGPEEGPPELFRPLDVSAVPALGRGVDVTATADECLALASRLGQREIKSLSARLEVAPVGGGAVRVTGTFDADVLQECVVTLEPVAARVSGPIEVTFVPSPARGDFDEDVDPHAEEVETIVDGTIDVGEVVVQHLAIAIDPYPRIEGAVFKATPTSGPGVEAAASPFAVLAKLRSASKSN
jgi:uncharacterized metal-binding protein YceD (DUF177 family)